MTFTEFAQHFVKRNLHAVDCGRGHWQLRPHDWEFGQAVLNWWPTSRKATVYVQDWRGKEITTRDVVDVSQVERIAARVWPVFKTPNNNQCEACEQHRDDVQPVFLRGRDAAVNLCPFCAVELSEEAR